MTPASNSPTIGRPPGSGLRRLLQLLILSLLLAGGIFYGAWRKTPTQPAIGSSADGPVAPLAEGKTTIRIGTFNIQSGKGADEVYNLDRTANTLRETDICGLQEVRGYFGGTPDEAHDLAARTSRAGIFAPTERRFWHDDFGNGLLCRLPVTRWERIPLPSDGSGGLRNLLLADIDVRGHIIHVLVTHIDRHTDQSAQIRFVSAIFESLAEPAVLLADMNQDSRNPDIHALLSYPGVHDCLGETLGLTTQHIDWILSRGLKPFEAVQNNNGASDHPFYSVDFEIQQ